MTHSHAKVGIDSAPETNEQRRKRKRRMTAVFALTTAYMLAEGAGGILTGSLALVADAGHMLTDAGALALALVAMRYAERPATTDKTFGFYRAEVLAAFSNAALLLLISIYILYEAVRRFARPPEVLATPMFVIAAIGMAVNFIGTRLLAGDSAESFNVKAAYLEVLSDMLGSVGVIVAAVIVRMTGWYLADPIFGAAIGLFIIPRTLKMLKDTAHVLMEGAPSDVQPAAIEQEMLKVSGVIKVHDVHVWTLTSGVHSVTGHVCVEDPTHGIHVMTELRRMLKQRFGIAHSTIQIEDQECRYGDLEF